MNKTITVYTSGSWDMFHIGHLNILKKSKALGDFLIVGVSTDELVKEYKGIGPIIPYGQRAQIVKSIRCVDKVVKQTVLTDIRQLKKYNVDIVTIGDDWKRKYLKGLEWMKKHGKVSYFPYTPGVSTTGLKRKIIKNSYELISAEFQRELKAGDKWRNTHSRFRNTTYKPPMDE